MSNQFRDGKSAGLALGVTLCGMIILGITSYIAKSETCGGEYFFWKWDEGIARIEARSNLEETARNYAESRDDDDIDLSPKEYSDFLERADIEKIPNDVNGLFSWVPDENLEKAIESYEAKFQDHYPNGYVW